jgi:predicted nucleotidyltransferase
MWYHGFAIPHDRSQFTLWEAKLRRDQAANEAERLRVLSELLRWLDAYAVEQGIEAAWIFGSLTRSNGFSTHSDIDLALAHDPNLRQFRIMSTLSTVLDRDVDVILLDDCPFANDIRREGIQWTRSKSAR